MCYKLLFTNKNCLISLDFIYFAPVLKCISISHNKIIVSVITHLGSQVKKIANKYYFILHHI